jgi:DNA invertase Pin-like site-specific DNA recombinase
MSESKRSIAPRVALYARVSTTDQHCEIQLRELQQYAANRGWAVAGEYIDKGWSGAKASRPELDRLMADALARKIDCILVYKVDRFGRSVGNLSEALKKLDSAGVRFISITQGIDTDKANSTSRFMLNILAAVAEFERDIIRERVLGGVKQYSADYAAGVIGKKKHSKSGKNLPIGRPKLIFDRETVRNMRLEGKSLGQISAATGLTKTTIRRVIGSDSLNEVTTAR